MTPMSPRAVNFPIGAYFLTKRIPTFKTCTRSGISLPETATNSLQHEVSLEKTYEDAKSRSGQKIIT
jgi:hypothetical protein